VVGGQTDENPVVVRRVHPDFLNFPVLVLLLRGLEPLIAVVATMRSARMSSFRDRSMSSFRLRPPCGKVRCRLHKLYPAPGIKFKILDYATQVEHLPLLSAIARDIGSCHVTAQKYMAWIVGTDSWSKHRSPAPGPITSTCW